MATFSSLFRPDNVPADWDAAFAANEQDIFFGDQAEMGLGGRVANAITDKNGGVILYSTRVKGAQATWGKAFDWCDYLGVIGNQRVGVTLMPDPANLRPSWLQNRDYGLMVANPFCRKAMKQGESRSQSAASEPTRLSVPFEAISSALHQNSAGICCLQC